MIYFAVSVFLSAFLLFQVQPLIGKYILPWFGGSAAVWSAALLFFMALLTGGYGYAFALINRLSRRRQGLVHLILLAASLVVLLDNLSAWPTPITPAADWQPQGSGFPVGHILWLLAAAVGLPYFLLTTNAPLMQAWFSQRWPDRSPYPLYALSNAGSLLALVSYPFLIEPTLSLTTQAWLWSAGYVAVVGWVAWGAIRQLCHRADPAVAVPTRDDPADPTAHADHRPSAGRIGLWLALPACASVLLLATTSKMTQEVAPIPFLWVLPLALYLLSYILSFADDRVYVRPLFGVGLAIATVLYAWVDQQGLNAPFSRQLIAFALLTFVACMVCHGELARLRPPARQLTTYYLMISVGGVLGGVAVNLVAPALFPGYWELPLAVIAGWGLFIGSILIGRPAWLVSLIPTRIGLAIVGVVSAYACLWFVDMRLATGTALLTVRNFYGVFEVSERNAHDPSLHAYRLYHGITLHGLQYASPELRRLPTAYYTEDSGIGLALLNHPARPGPLRVGMLGLGIGGLVAYCQPDDVWRLYEINPAVVRIAEGEGGYFHYLTDCAGEVQIVLGDARLALQRELARGERQVFDLLVMDAFNSDSVPVHLLTREAVALYLEHVAPDGLLAINISNRFLDLRPVVWGLADYYGLHTALISIGGDGERRQPSVWMLAARRGDLLSVPAIAERTTPRPDPAPAVRLWTDDYSNLFQILH
jgi:hypothetical protein